MPFTTLEQFVLLGTVLIGGFLLGYASAPNAAKWKRRLRAQSERFTAFQAEAKDHIRAANQRANDLRSDLEAVRADHAEAERTITGLRAGTATGPDEAPIEAEAPRKGWFARAD